MNPLAVNWETSSAYYFISCTTTPRARQKRHLREGLYEFPMGRTDIEKNGAGVPPSRIEHLMFYRGMCN